MDGGQGILLGLLVLICVAQAYIGKEAVSGDYSTIYTPPNEHDYKGRILQVLQTNVINFKVKACSDVHILLAHTVMDTENDATEIVIGGWENTLSVIRVGLYGEHVQQVDTPGILGCGEFREFWIHFSGSYIEVGYGPNSHLQAFMRTDRRGHSVHDVGFSTGYGHSGVWQIRENMGHRLHVYTPNSDPLVYQFVSKTMRYRTKFFQFEVHACSDAHIAMGPSEVDLPQQWPYQLVLGAYDNSQACMWYISSDNIICSDPVSDGIVSCDEPRLFWVSWFNGHIKMGRGIVFEKEVLFEWQDNSFQGINVMSFSTGWGYDGMWMFDEDLANKYTFGNVPSRQPEAFLRWSFVPRTSHAYFNVMSCDEVHVALAAGQPRNSDTDFLYVFFGGSGNTKSGVKTGVDGQPTDVLYEVDTPDLLKCNYLVPIWVHFSSRKYVSAGVGGVSGLNELFRYDLPESNDPFRVYFVGYSNPSPDAVWTVPMWSGDEMLIDTPQNYGYNDTWVSVYLERGKVFQVVACEDVHIILSDLNGVSYARAHEVIIGYEGNQRTVIKNHVDGRIHANEETPGVLDCNELKHFWVAWDRNYIRVGTGDRIGRDTIAEMTERYTHDVYSMSLSSKDSNAKFTIENDVGDTYVVQTPTHSLDYKWSHMNTGYDWIYFKVMASSACLIVSTKYRDSGSGYTLHIGEEMNTQTSLYKGDKLLVRETTPNILNAGVLRSFWLGCVDGMLQFGKGKLNNGAVSLQYKAGKSCDFNSIGYAGLGGAVAFWKFYERQGMGEFTYDTSVNHDFDQQWIGVIHRTHMTFAVQACHSVGIMLSTFMGSHNWHNTYVIELQNQMGMSAVWGPYYSSSHFREKYVEIYTPDLFSCNEERMFWVSWYGGHFAVGQGNDFGTNTIISHHDFDPVPVRAISFSTNATWGIFRNTYRSSGFVEVPSGSGGLSAGEVVAAVFGFLALFALFGAALYVIIKPPEQLKPYILPPGAPHVNPNPMGASTPAPGGFDNPLNGTHTPAQPAEQVEIQAEPSGPALTSDPFYQVNTVDEEATPAGLDEPDLGMGMGGGNDFFSMNTASGDLGGGLEMNGHDAGTAKEDEFDIFA